MKIKNFEEKKKQIFSDLKVGDVFLYDKELFIVIKEVKDINNIRCNAMHLITTDLFTFSEEDSIGYKENATLLIDGE